MLSAALWASIGIAGATAIAVGLRRHRPSRSGPWWLLAAAIVAMAIGDVGYALGVPALAELSYLAMFPLVTIALLQLTRSGAIFVDRARLIDLLAFTCAALLAVWVFVIGSENTGPHDGVSAMSAADALGDLLLVIVAGRLVMAARRNASAILLGIGALGMLASDIAYPMAPGPLSELGYAVLYLAWGAAALHPSMSRLMVPTPAQPAPWDHRCSTLLGVSVGIPPTVLLTEALTGEVRDGLVIAVASGLTIVLAITRLADSLELHSRALAREHALREASAALVSAADVPEVDIAVRAAVRSLLPRGVPHRVVVATDDRESSTTRLLPPPGTSHPRSWWLPDTDEATNGFESILVCPLWLEPLAVARPRGGALVLMSRQDALATTRDALEVLAGQAALALDRIALVAAVGLNDSDQYLRAVIQNTADIMLVTDEDHRIRYASPALSALLGVELPPFAMLHDLVHPDDLGDVKRALRSGTNGRFYCTLQQSDGTQIPIEGTFRDLREDRLVQGFVLTIRDLTDDRDRAQWEPHRDGNDGVPAWINRRSVRDKYRY